MNTCLGIMNDGAVGIFGAILSAAFSSIQWNKKNKIYFGMAVGVLGTLQAILFMAVGAEVLRLWYPIIMHLPLFLLLGVLSRKWMSSLTAVLVAYLCCQLRRWIALACVLLFSGGKMMQTAIELAVTAPLTIILIRSVAPSIRAISNRKLSLQIEFSLIPAIEYIFDYLACVYTDLLISGIEAVVEFMPFVCALAYLFFILHYEKNMRKQNELEQMQVMLNMQLRQSVYQIEELQKSQEMAAAYRHDLRHHLQYLAACLHNGNQEQAQQYISRLEENIAQQAVRRYCENTAVNLMLSSFDGRATEAGISMSIQMRIGKQIGIADSDLCVLLSNAFENALHACQIVENRGGQPFIELRGYEKKNHLFLEITNSFAQAPVFRNGIPVSEREGHGIGVRSICAVVEKYGGIYNFEAIGDTFVLRISL